MASNSVYKGMSMICHFIISFNNSHRLGKATLCFERSLVTGALHVRVLKIPGTIESIVPGYNGQLQMPTEGALLMSRRAGKEPIPIDFNHRGTLRHMAENFNDKMPGVSNRIHFLIYPDFLL
jgi:hypothetical protein